MRILTLLLGFCSFLLIPAIGRADYTGPLNGHRVAFMGDSITSYGWSKPAGYVQLVAKALELQGNKIVVIPAGVGGNTSADMLARLDASVISRKPDWMLLSCGVNDVWHGPAGVSQPDYEKNMTEIVTRAQNAGIKVIIMTATMIGEDDNPNNQKLKAYNDFLRLYAQQSQSSIIDLNAAMQEALAAEQAKYPLVKGNLLTIDGVHMTPVGDRMMASAILKAWGMPEDQINQAFESFNTLGCGTSLAINPNLNVSQYLQLRDLAGAQGRTVDAMFNDMVKKDVETLLNSSPAPASGATPPTPPPAPAKP